LVPGVRRVPPGSILEFEAYESRRRRWYDLGSLPSGESPIDGRAIEELEEVFQQAMCRCLQVFPAGEVYLPLSSGDDSRRILAALLHRNVDFHAITVRILQKGFRDLDARYSGKLASRFKFRHRIVSTPDLHQYYKNDHDVRLILGSETTEHAWLAPLVRSIGDHEAIVFDGLGGDVFGNTGYEIADLHTCDDSSKLKSIGQITIPSAGSRVIEESQWAPLDQARAELIEFLSKQSLPAGPNFSDVAFILSRVTRSTSLWTHQLLPVGCVPVFPYFDLDHVRVSLQYRPLDKLIRPTQDRCLERFWPEFYSVPGSRRFSSDLSAELKESGIRYQCARLERLCRNFGGNRYADVSRCLKSPYRELVWAALNGMPIRYKLRWWLESILVLEDHRLQSKPGCWYESSTNEIDLALA
jgi:asparagine synthetase B (glutamine-hydrolysing)